MCLSLRAPPPPFLFPFLKGTLFIDVCSYTGSSPTDEGYQPADTIFVIDEAVCYSGELVAVGWNRDASASAAPAVTGKVPLSSTLIPQEL